MAIKNINTDLQVEAGLRDGDGDLGTNNQILISTGTGINWVDGSGSGIIGGPYLPLVGGTLTGNLTISGGSDIFLADNGKTHYGANNDLEIYHNGTHSYIDEKGTGDLIIRSTLLRLQSNGGESMINASSNGTVQLYYDNSEKLKTATTGITITGAATATTFLGDLNGTINTATTAVTKPNATDDTTVATTAFVQNLIGTIPAGLVFQGTWNAATNTPTLTSGSGTTGHFYIVSTSGSTNLDGVTDWVTGDWAVFIEQGATDAWEKIDNSSVLDGTGTGNQITKWAGSGTSNTLTDSIITDNGTNVEVDGTFTATGNSTIQGRTNLQKDLIIRGTDTLANQGAARLYVDNSNKLFIDTANDGLGLVTIDSTGNVGVGTTSPSRPLSVYRSTAGSAANFLHYTDATAFAGLYIDVDNVNNIVELNASGDTSSTMAFQTGNAERMRITTTGNVGIGTTSPTQKLDVAGSIRTNNQLTVFNTDLSKQVLKVNAEATTNTGILKLYNGVNWGLLVRGESNGPYIGSYYGGSFNITGFEDSTGTTTSAIKLAQFVFGGTGGGSGYLTLNGDLRVNNNKKIKFGYANSQQNGIEWVAGSKISAAITPVDTANFSRTGLGFFTGDFSDGTTNADERMRITRAGNVGIGTTSPGAKLEVAADATTNVDIVHFSNSNDIAKAKISLSANSSGELSLIDGSNNTDVFITSNGNSYFNGGNVGIGTATPSTKLHVSGGVKITENLNVEGTGNVTIRNTTTVGSGIIFIDTTWQAGIEHQSGKLFFRTGGQTNRMVIDGSGNVGISTTSPGQKLHVVGEGKIQGNLMVGSSGDVSGAAGQLHIKGPNAQVIVLEDTDNANLVVRLSAEETVGFKIEDTTNSNVLFFGDENGNIGIGTITPATKLHVEDTTNPQARIAYDANNYVQVSVNGSGDTTIAPTGNGIIAPDLTLSAGSAYIKVDAQTNNVGIKTTNPRTALEVLGKIRVWSGSNTHTYVETSSGSNLGSIQGKKNSDSAVKALALNPLGGNIGINLGAGIIPTRQLTLSGNSSPIISLASNTTGGEPSIYFGDTDDDNEGRIVYSNSQDAMQIWTAAAERIRVTSAGDTGIGVTAPRAKLDVAGGVKVANDTDTASANKVGTLRYRYVPGSPKNYSYVDMCMQTGASSYAWVNIVQNVWN